MRRAGAAAVDKAVALVFEADWALRQLLKRALEHAGFETRGSSTFVELDLKLRLRALRTAPRVLLVLGETLSSRAEPAIRALADQRASEQLGGPRIVLTRELGSASPQPRSELGGCGVVATLEKPFDLAWFQAIAFRCRTAVDDGSAATGAAPAAGDRS